MAKTTDETASRTTLHVSLTLDDKIAIKMLAAKQNTTIAALIHEWIDRAVAEEERN